MFNNLRYGLIFLAITTVLLTIPSCAKEQLQTEAPVAQGQETEMATVKSQEELEEERTAREAAESMLRAEKIKFMYEDVYFQKGRYRLNPEAQEILQRKAAWLLNNPDLNVIIEGHTNNRGSKEYNFALGDRRAGAVKSFLIKQGVESPRLIAVSYGNERPIDNSKTEKGRAKNRRVHFVVEE